MDIKAIQRVRSSLSEVMVMVMVMRTYASKMWAFHGPAQSIAELG
jgi:hypothetical protein